MEVQVRKVLSNQDLTASMKLILVLVLLQGGRYQVTNKELSVAIATNISTVIRCLTILKRKGLIASVVINKGREWGKERTLVFKELH